MSEEKKKISLAQFGGGEEERLERVRREKLGDLAGIQGQGVATEIVGAETMEQKMMVEKVIEAIRTIYDPEIPLNIYDLGLIYKLTIDATNRVKVEMTLTAPGCPVAGELVAAVKKKVEGVAEVGRGRAEVELVWEPAWTRERLSEAARLELGMV
ncbi:MAG: iron-sulfur cluster assembly protein [Phycisphaerales bacterium]|nr:iron-sulfur cluster assembly protein [Phycisphaerales bacterium]